MAKSKKKITEFQRLALKPTNQERFVFRFVTLLSIIIFSLWYISINGEFLTIENLVILGIVIVAIGGVIYYYKLIKDKI